MADSDIGSERTPLLTTEGPHSQQTDLAPARGISPPPSYSQPGPAATIPVGADELPPPYSPPSHGFPVINCKVCQAVINLEGKQHLHVVKCHVCGEATPIRAAPPGRKYVRCQCNLLLVCRSGATKILCPRETCRRVTSLTTVSEFPATPSPSRLPQYRCGYCSRAFVMTRMGAFVKCPHCRRTTQISVSRIRAHLYLLFGILFLGLAIGITVGTYEQAQETGGIYVSWIGGFIIGLVFIVRSVFYYTVKRSLPLNGNIQGA